MLIYLTPNHGTPPSQRESDNAHQIGVYDTRQNRHTAHPLVAADPAWQSHRPYTLLNQMVKMLIGTNRLMMLRPCPIRALTVFIDSKHYSALQISI
jgi:hypothetical protein